MERGLCEYRYGVFFFIRFFFIALNAGAEHDRHCNSAAIQHHFVLERKGPRCTPPCDRISIDVGVRLALFSSFSI